MNRSAAQSTIRSNLSAGAVGEYLDGDTALEMLGDIFKLYRSVAERGESLQEHLRRIDTAVGVYLEAVCDRIVAENVDFLLEAHAPDPRVALRPNLLAFDGVARAA